MSDFWIQSLSIQKLQELLRHPEKGEIMLWEAVQQAIKKEENAYFEFPLAHSNTFYGFNDDLGNMPYETQEEEANKKFKAYEQELSALLDIQPNKDLQPKLLDFDKVENQKEWDVYYQMMDTHPITYYFGDDFTVWSNDKVVLFLSMNKEDKELPYEINFGGLGLKSFQKTRNDYHKMKHDIESGKYAHVVDEEYENEDEEIPEEPKIYNATNIQKTINEKVHDLSDKLRAIRSFVGAGHSLPQVFDDGRLLIFHILDSINYIVDPLRKEDVEYINLALENGAHSQLNSLDTTTGMTPVLYAYAKGLTPFAEFLETKGAQLQKELQSTTGTELLVEQLVYSTHYRREKLIKNILPFIPADRLKEKEIILWEKLVKGNIYGEALTISSLFIVYGLNPSTPLANGMTVLHFALLQHDQPWITALEKQLPIKDYINKTDNQGNSLLHLWATYHYNNDLPKKGIYALQQIVAQEPLATNLLNHNKQNALHLLATREIDPHNEKDLRKKEMTLLQQAFDLICTKVTHYNQQDADGNTALHYMAGYHFLTQKNGSLKPRWFSKRDEQLWRLAVIKKLIALGAAPTLKNNLGQTAADIAQLCKMKEIAQLL